MTDRKLFDDAELVELAAELDDDTGLVVRSLGVKAINRDSRSVDVLASTDTLDSHGDIVEQSWNLDRYRSNPVVLFAHDHKSLPVGHADMVRVEGGALMARLNFVDAKANPIAEQVYQSFLQGSLRAVSVGFVPHQVRAEHDENGKQMFVLSDNELHEISAVPIPSNPDTLGRMKQRASGKLENSAEAIIASNEKRDPRKFDLVPDRVQDNAADSGREGKNMDQEKAISEANEQIAKHTAELEIERSKSTALQSRCDDLDAELNKATTIVSELTSEIVERDLDALVGVKMSAAEKPGLIKLATLDREVFNAQVEAIKSRPAMATSSHNVLGNDPNQITRGTDTAQDNNSTGGMSLAARIAAANV
jgi:HK97 family phage prohead protease